MGIARAGRQAEGTGEYLSGLEALDAGHYGSARSIVDQVRRVRSGWTSGAKVPVESMAF